MRYFSNISSDKQMFIKSLILGVVSSVAIIAMLLCAMSVIFLSASLLPYEYLSYIMLIIDAIGVLLGSYIAARINKSQGLILGLLNGFIVFVALVICGFATTSESLTIITGLKAVIILLFSAFGGIKGVNVKEKIRIK